MILDEVKLVQNEKQIKINWSVTKVCTLR
jgi:hypothetical protein